MTLRTLKRMLARMLRVMCKSLAGFRCVCPAECEASGLQAARARAHNEQHVRVCFCKAIPCVRFQSRHCSGISPICTQRPHTAFVRRKRTISLCSRLTLAAIFVSRLLPNINAISYSPHESPQGRRPWRSRRRGDTKRLPLPRR